MFRQWRHMLAAGAVVCALRSVLWADSGYLPDVGPVPLRFQTAPTPLTNWASAPAPVLPDQKPVEAEPSNSLPQIAPVPEAIVAEAKSPAPTPDPAAAAAPMAAPTVISPQMLVKFFTPAGGATSPTTTPAPPQQSIGFTPPIPAAPAPNTK